MILSKSNFDTGGFTDICLGTYRIEFVDKVQNLKTRLDNNFRCDLYTRTKVFGWLRSLTKLQSYNPLNTRLFFM